MGLGAAGFRSSNASETAVGLIGPPSQESFAF